VQDRSILTWFKTVTAAYPWIPIADLRTGNSAKTRYTPLYQTLFDEYRREANNTSADDWIASVHVAHPTEYEAWLNQSKPSPQPTTAYTFYTQDTAAIPEVDVDDQDSIKEPELPVLETTVETSSNLTIPNPVLPQTYDMAGQQPNEAPSFKDPLALAAQIVAAVGNLQTAMQRDIAQKKQKLADTQQAAKQIQQAVTDLNLDRRFYAANAERLAETQTERTQTLTELAQTLQSLGKAPSPPTVPPATQQGRFIEKRKSSKASFFRSTSRYA